MRLFLILLFSFIQTSIMGQSAPITIDGVYDDWSSSLTTFTDPTETISGIDLLEMQVTNDGSFLYIKITTDTEFDLTTNLISQGLMLYIDTDNNPTTGYPAQDGYGSEIGINFKERFSHFNVYPYSEISFADMQLTPAPTVTSNEFEIAISLSAIPDGINPLFTSSTIRILFKDINSGDSMPNDGVVFFYTFDETPVPAIELIDINKETPNLVRILAYNTLYSGLVDASRVGAFESVITSLQPDIIGFSECGSTSIGAVKTLLDNWLPLGTSYGWYVQKDSSDDLITASRWEILENWQSLYRQFPVLIDLPEEYNTDLLFTNAHLRCCAANDLRQEQVDDYVSFMLDALEPGGEVSLPENTPFVYAGDLNLVGLAQQQTTLITGDIQNTGTYGTGSPYDWDNTNVTDQICRLTDKRMAYTWKDDSSSYPDGRLDYIIFSDAVMSAQKAFTLQTEIISSERLDEFSLYEFDTSIASDHFPVVTDFLIHAATGTEEQAHFINKSPYPNPVTDYLHFDFTHPNTYSLQVFDSKGVHILTQKSVQSKSIKLDLKSFTSGFYFVAITNEGGEKEWFKFFKN